MWSLGLLLYLYFNLLSLVNSLMYQDCSLQTESPYLSLLYYAHDPDPYTATENRTIEKTFRYSGLAALTSLHETVDIDKSTLPPWDENFEGWTPHFSNSFGICGSSGDSHAELCPIEPGSTITYVDNHSPSSQNLDQWYRANEKFYDSEKKYIGCVTVVYQVTAKR